MKPTNWYKEEILANSVLIPSTIKRATSACLNHTLSHQFLSAGRSDTRIPSLVCSELENRINSSLTEQWNMYQ